MVPGIFAEIASLYVRMNVHAAMHRYLQQRRDKQGPHFTYEVRLRQLPFGQQSKSECCRTFPRDAFTVDQHAAHRCFR